MKLYIYDINKTETNENVDFASELEKALCEKRTGKDRLMMLNKAESDDADLICTHSYRNGILCGSFMRLAMGKESVMSQKELEKDNVNIEEIIKKAKDENAGSIKDVFYFAIKKSVMVLNSNSAKSLSTYIRWLFDEVELNLPFKFENRIAKCHNFNAEDIKSVRLEEGYVNSRFTTQQKSLFYNLKKELLEKLLSELPDDTKDLGKIVSAQLLLKFHKKAIQKEEDLKFALRATDDDCLTIETRDGRKFKGTEIKDRREISPEKTSEGAISWVSICDIMKEILQEL